MPPKRTLAPEQNDGDDGSDVSPSSSPSASFQTDELWQAVLAAASEDAAAEDKEEEEEEEEEGKEQERDVVQWMREYAGEASSPPLLPEPVHGARWVNLLQRHRQPYFGAVEDRFDLLCFVLLHESDCANNAAALAMTEDAFMDLVDDFPPALLHDLLRFWYQCHRCSARQMCEIVGSFIYSRRARSLLVILFETLGLAVQTDMCRAALNVLDADTLALFLRLGYAKKKLRAVLMEPAYRAQVANMAAVVDVLRASRLLAPPASLAASIVESTDL